MKQTHTWTTIAEERDNAHNKVVGILHASKRTSSFLNEYGKAIGAATFGLALLAGSFFLPGSDLYKAALEAPQIPGVSIGSESSVGESDDFLLSDEAIDFEDEAQDIDIEPLLTVDALPASDEVVSDDLEVVETAADASAPFDIAEEAIDFPEAVSLPSTSSSSFDEEVADLGAESPAVLNPFDSVVSENTTVAESQPSPLSPYAEDTDFPVAPKATTYGSSFDSSESFHSAAPAAGSFSPFKENTHTYDTVSTPVVSQGELQDPLNDIASLSMEEENLHGVARIVSVTEKEEDFETESKPYALSYKHSDDGMYTGVLRPRHRPENFSHPFAFFLELDDGTKMKLNTNRDLRSVLGQELTIEIDGTIDDFVLQHVYYKPQVQRPELAKSGPESLMILVGLLALGMSLFRKRV